MPDILIDIPINAEKTQIFEAITNPKSFEQWWPKRCFGVLENNSIYNFYFGKAYNWFAIVLKYSENENITYQFIEADEDWIQTTLNFAISEIDGKNWLELKHCNWPQNNRQFRYSTHCWAMLMTGLKNFLEKGEIIAFENRN